MKVEIQALKENKTWEIVQLPPGKSPISFKWVFKVKYQANGAVERFKARLLAKGYNQHEGLDYQETFLPVVKIVTVISMAAAQGDLYEEVYMKLLEGFASQGENKGAVCRLVKSLYGLKQASRQWNVKLIEALIKQGFLWDVICDGPYVPTKNLGDPPIAIPKTRKEFNDADRKAIEKNFRAKKILVCGIGPDEYNRISACQSAKEIWEALQTAHEGTTQVKQSKINMLTTEYELFRMQDDESVQEMHTRFTSIINELHSLCETIPRNKLVRKILSMLPNSWESKVNTITEAKDLQELIIDEFVGNLKTYKMKKKKESER
ncbi:PREDICTED: uncharacterized protein LOC109216534 [Nicotiana attenuata]|uniref:uncharacterized protein LOC109216534 n=1 Tax=Nicotiana attenuata TaxID=49451 RepID=UPI000904D626|nr:PREDICTED: uncharacterized protein LOC109216534 [Nicotiana attenuata]